MALKMNQTIGSKQMLRAPARGLVCLGGRMAAVMPGQPRAVQHRRIGPIARAAAQEVETEVVDVSWGLGLQAAGSKGHSKP